MRTLVETRTVGRGQKDFAHFENVEENGPLGSVVRRRLEVEIVGAEEVVFHRQVGSLVNDAAVIHRDVGIAPRFHL